MARVRKRCPLENGKEVNVFEYCPSKPGNCDICPKLRQSAEAGFEITQDSSNLFIKGAPKTIENIKKESPMLRDMSLNRGVTLMVAGVIVTEPHEKFEPRVTHQNSCAYLTDCNIKTQRAFADCMGIDVRTVRRDMKSGKMDFVHWFGGVCYSHISSLTNHMAIKK